MPDVLKVEVMLALPGKQVRRVLMLAPGTSVIEAVAESGLLDAHPELARETLSYGVFSKLRKPGDPVQDGDRVEIYRPLKNDPREARRARVARGTD